MSEPTTAPADGASVARRTAIFVDDEPRVLDGLRRSLFAVRDRWAVRTATSGDEALALMRDEPAQVVVSDLQMPGMDGLALLTHVAEQWPATVRVVLSGQTNAAVVARAWAVAHQSLAKPCETPTLLAALERAGTLAALLNDPAVRGLAGRLQSLPTTPGVLLKVEELTRKESSASSALEQIIREDAALTAKVLQVVNSAYFGLRREVLQVEVAVSIMGFQLLRGIIMSHEIGHAFPCRIPDWSPEEAHQHGLEVASLAKRLGETPAEASDLFTAGILHDVGKLVMASRAPAQFQAALDEAARTNVGLYEIERQHHGADHADVGAYLLALWGLPWQLVEAVGMHHAPERWATASTRLAPKLALVQDVLRETRGTGSLDDDRAERLRDGFDCLGDAVTVGQYRDIVRHAIGQE